MSLQSNNDLPDDTGSHDRWLSFAICLLLALAVWIAFGQTRHFQFVNYDDAAYVYENPAITGGLSLHGIVRAFTHNDGAGEWLPLTAISRMLDWQLYGANAGGHHLTNVLLHAATAILLFLVLRNMTGALWRSAFVAAVFAIHPLRVESVAWVTERKDVLSGLFFMLTLLCYAKAVAGDPLSQRFNAAGKGPVARTEAAHSPVVPRVTGHESRFYWLALLCFTFGLLSKSTLVTLPFVLLLLDYWPLQRMTPASGLDVRRIGHLALEKIPFLLLSAAACVATVLSQKDAIKSVQDVDSPSRISNALVAYTDYLGQMLYPVGLAVLYPHPGNHLSVWHVGLAVLVLLSISAGVLAGCRKHPYLLVGWLWYLGMLVPVIGFVQVGEQARADRYTYLPQIGLYILVAWGVAELCGALRWRRAVLGSSALATLAGLLAVAYVQTGYWKDSIALWTHTLACTSGNAFAHYHLGSALADQAKPAEAIQQYEQALQLKPDYPEALNNFGIALARQGKLAEAIQHYERVLQLRPGSAGTLNNLGAALAGQGKWAEAIQRFQQALQLNPDDAEVHNNLGKALAAQGKWAEATQHYERALQVKPDDVDAHYNLGRALAAQGKLAEAMQHYERALQLKPDYPEALNTLGIALARQGELAEAVQHFQRALQLKPDYADAQNNLGKALAGEGQWDEAIPHFKRALQLKPDDVAAQYNLGIALAAQGKLDEAIPHFQQALALATAQGNTALAESIRARLKSYQPASPQPQTP